MITAFMLAAVLSIKVVPSVCLSPCTIKLVLKVDDARASDHLQVDIDGAEFQSFDIVVEEGRRTYEIPKCPTCPFILLRGDGEWTIRATLFRRVDHRYDAVAKVIVGVIDGQ